MTSSRLQALIVGAGLMGQHHAKAAAASGAAIACIVDQDLAAAKRLAAQYGHAEARTELKEVLKLAKLQVAHVCTPVSSHLAIAGLLADAGMHALIEKPFAANALEVRRIHEEFARKHGGKLACPTHQYAFQRSVTKATATLPALGVLKRISFDVCSAGAARGHVSGDELLAEILPHLLAVLQRLQPQLKLHTLYWTLVRVDDGEWNISAPMGGCLLTMTLSSGGRPTRFRSCITGTNASLEIDHFHDFALFQRGPVSKAQKILAPFSRGGRELLVAGSNLFTRALRQEYAYPGLRQLVSEFYAAVRNSAPAPITPEQSIAVAEARDAILALAPRG